MPQFKTPASVVAEANDPTLMSLEEIREAEGWNQEAEDWMENESGEPLALDEAYQRLHGRSDW